MIICKKCGNHNQDQETFCSSCNAFLEWSGERVVEPATAPPATAPPATAPAPPRPAESGWVPPASVAARAAPPAGTPGGAPATPAGPEPAPVPAAAPPVAPVAREPQAMPPTPPRPRPVARTAPAPSQPYQPGDLVCGQCGAGNRPERHFCRRCGASLAEAVVARTPWYRRLLPARQVPLAGDRRAVRTGPGTGGLIRTFLLATLAVVLVGGLLAYAALPGFRDALNRRVYVATTELRRQIDANYVPVRPSQTTASSQLSGHPGQLTSDLVSNDYWAADTARDPQPTLEFTFAGPTDLDYVIVTSGAAGADYARMARPRTVELTYSDGSGEELVLKDDPKATGYVIHAHQVRSVSMRIASVYPTTQSSAVAIAEVEFFRLG